MFKKTFYSMLGVLVVVAVFGAIDNLTLLMNQASDLFFTVGLVGIVGTVGLGIYLLDKIVHAGFGGKQ